MAQFIRNNNRISNCVICAILPLAIAPKSFGADDAWKNPAGGSFQDGTNWSAAAPPSAGDNAIFNLGSATGYTVDFSANAQTQQLSVGNDTLTLNLTGHQFATTEQSFMTPAATFGLAAGQKATVTATNGSLAFGQLTTIGQAADSQALLTLNGTHLSGTQVVVGNFGIGEVDLNSGATVTTTQTALGYDPYKLTSGSGTIRVSGAGSSWVQQGTNGATVVGGPNMGQGSIFVADGGLFQSNGGIDVADGAAGNGSIVVTGVSGQTRSRLTWTGGSIGSYGNGLLRVENGALATDSNILVVGETFGSQGTVDVGGAAGGFNAQLSVTATLYLGDSESGQPPGSYSGTLNLNAGGSVSANAVYLGNGDVLPNGPGVGIANIAGGTLTTNGINLQSGTVNISGGTVNGGSVRIGGFPATTSYIQSGGVDNIVTLQIGSSSFASPATLSLAGGMLFVATNTENDATFTQSGGIASLKTVTGNGTMTVGGSAAGTGTLTAVSITQKALTVHDGGIVKLAHNSTPNLSSTNQLTVNFGGTLDLSNNLFRISYGTAPDPDAAVRTAIINGYQGGTWKGAGITSSLAAANPARFAVGYADFTTSKTELIKFTYAGDATLDGRVNVSDLGILATHFGQRSGANWSEGDFNYDGKVDVTDLGILATNFGQGTALTAAQAQAEFAADLRQFPSLQQAYASLPEPVVMPILVALPVLLIRRRRLMAS